MPIPRAAPSRARALVSSLYAAHLIGLCAMASSAPLMRRHSTAFAMVGFGPLRPPQPQLRHLRGGGLVPNPLSGAGALITGAKKRVGQLAGRLGLRMNVDHDAEEILPYRTRFEDLATTRDGMMKEIKSKKSQGKGSGGRAAAKKVVIIGSGNFASALAPIVGKNCERLDEMHTTVNMWVYEEEFEGQKLSEVINTEHENKKYLPGIKLPDNIVAVTNVTEAVKDANVLIFCVPHQFMGNICSQIRGHTAPGCIAVSLIKGVHFDESGIVLISSMLSKELGGMDVSVLMGANLAWEIARGSFCETTIGYRRPESGRVIREIFDDPLFRVGMVPDIPGVEACGALKNVVALGAGFCDGLELGDNSKGAIIRIGLMEMKKFIQQHFPGVKDETFFQSCGVADLIVTCYGGRNRRCAEAFVRAKGDKTFSDLEQELLGGQKLQGTPAAKEVFKILEKDDDLDEYPLFTSVYRIAFCGAPPESMIAAVACYGTDQCEVILG